ncbi:GAF domain-containing protein [Anoxybacillus sp. MB8]|uniref:GAF domain-containing protein n=1 Tax=Anoxybacillus sp. MB8 TaxID=2496850 RepID=UPI0013D23880|nr:GAF domain-containing protein [Anoxybacillus sp. MB8]
MFHAQTYKGTREENYALVIDQLKALISDEKNVVANLANASALLNYFLHDINWVGFYITEGNELVLGPFQGLPACVRIPFGKGVCGTAAAEKRTVRVADVHTFPGHIACDAASQSEIVVPMIKDGRVIGVLDIDSPIKNRFDEVDEQYLQQFVETLIQYVNI